jgi:CDP-paratose 2-epimerase
MSGRILITGSSGLIGSEMARFFAGMGWEVHGVDNNMRARFFGIEGDTMPVRQRLTEELERYTHYDLDIRERESVIDLVRAAQPSFIVHAAAQPSHDLAKDNAFVDFDVNAVGTLNLLEAARRAVPSAPFVFLSTNKVYGDAPNRLPLVEKDTRYDYADEARVHGIDETCSIDGAVHTLMGASKLSADILVQEYGSYMGLPTVSFRCGCLTGPAQAGVEQHGFLSYMSKAVREGRTYRIFGYGGKQVRDNLHAVDVCRAAFAFYLAPRAGAVYNLGGGRANSVSVIEALERFGQLYERVPLVEYVEDPRKADHLCYISDTRKFQADYPSWNVTRSLEDILAEFVLSEAELAAV